MSRKNYFQISRKLLDHPLWTSEPFTKGQAWVDLIGRANHADGHFYKKGQRVDVKRGQNADSILTLKNRWGWSRGKVSRFLNLLETEQRIVQHRGHLTTLITICNYNAYQLGDYQSGTTDGTTNKTSDGHQTGHQTDIRRDTNKKNRKEPKKNKEEEKQKPSLATEVINYLNETCGKTFKPKVEANRKIIRAREAEGATLEEFKAVIDHKFREWGNGDVFRDKETGEKKKASDFLRPSTLFRPSNFENYLNEARSAEGINGKKMNRDEFRKFMDAATEQETEEAMFNKLKQDEVIHRIVRKSFSFLFENKISDYGAIWRRYQSDTAG